MMNRQSVRVGVFFVVLLLVGCTTTWDGVVLPNECDSFSISPRLDRVTYMCGDVLWLAPLPSLQGAVPVVQPGDSSALWNRWVYWRPDGAAFIMKLYDPTEGTIGWWLVSADNLEARTYLCTLSSGWVFAGWSLNNSEFVLIHRGAWGGGVTLAHTDGSGCEELPIPGLVMKTLSISLSPDGQKVAYVHIPYRESLDAAEVRIIDVSTYETSTLYSEGGLPRWFPDGEAFALFGRGDVIPVVRGNGSGIVGKIEIPEGYDLRLSRGNIWSPDGSQLALYLKMEGLDYKPVAIGILNRDTLAISVIEAPYFYEIVGWTPDGNKVVILRREAEGYVLREVPVGR